MYFLQYICFYQPKKTVKKIIKQYFNVAVSVDNVVFGFDADGLKVLLISRGSEPFSGSWALPGDLISPEMDLEYSAERVLKQLTGLDQLYMEQIQTFGRVDRHPFGRVFTIAYFALIKVEQYHPQASSWAKDVAWFKVTEIPTLPFDHREILEYARRELKNRIRTQTLVFELLPKYFTLTELQFIHESILEEEFDVRNFRKKTLSSGIIEETGRLQKNVTHRPAKLYRFNASKAKQLDFEGGIL